MFKHDLSSLQFVYCHYSIFPFQLLVLSSVVVDFQYKEYIYWVKHNTS